ncbi:UDP-N-acetylmuramoyl-L-alanine--D-glutamate ligase [bacterium CPR1]|nr:UDP-N-acetylmuramoyl-L-alanine--D-glutamate ligase [bacterium CPR1]
MKGKRVAVLGMGKSGIALVRELKARGALPFISDQRSSEQLQQALEQLHDVPHETGAHTDRVLEQDMLVISPGISVHAPIVKQALARGLEVAGEVELAYRFSRAPFVAVTGTNGKSTTVTLIHHMLEPRSILAGNIGNPLVAEVGELGEDRLVVAEISSFQLETTHRFRPHVAVLTNITPDHLDRHPTLEEYQAAKARLFAYQTPQDFAVFPADDAPSQWVLERLREGRLPAWLPGFPPPDGPARPQVLEFSATHPVERGAWLQDGQIVLKLHDQPRALFPWSFPGLPGPHNLLNALAAVCAAGALGVEPDQMRRALEGHHPLHHRMEVVAEVGGVRFVDDSKATNASSVEAALETFEGPIVLIAGGKEKGTDFTELGQAIARRVRHLVLIGEAAPRLAQAAEQAGHKQIHHAGHDFPRAVETARRLAEPGGVVLLSPACASFDMFKNAEDRGDQFRALVRGRVS